MEALSELRWLTQQLKLTPEQADKIRPIVTDEGEQLHLVKLDERLPLDQKRAKMLEIREAFRPKIAALLTPEQQEKWKQLQPAAPGKAPEAPKDSSAPPNK
jgi:Spy/CpxP family protein refolding chaperone